MIGQEVEVLFEEKDGEYYKGHTQNYIEVRCKEENSLENNIIQIKVLECSNTYLIGKNVTN